ncbi:velvet factor-domain-containing protein [Mycena pura]|uniref:Velvet factor-domain-containing protein n=1 Tax=Mycena pura TaxID=153505 RepID=A0AAD6VMG5_9AGAR|nr:velvet factor-domain-containing protein [Mycena pura]
MLSPSRAQQHGEPHHQYSNGVTHQQSQASLIGRPIHFTEGQFAGKTIRATLQELQAASFGRKYAKVDRRPLDPPPVACLRLFEVFNAGTDAETETEVDYDSIHMLGLMCTVELIPVPPPPHSHSPESSPPATPSYGSAHSQYSPTPSPNGTYTFGSPAPMSPEQSNHNFSHSAYDGGPGMHLDYASMSGGGVGPHKATAALAGTTFVQVDSIPWKGRTSLLFTFADLAVKTEGYFILQYRFFDIYSKQAGHTDQRIQADCYGASFRIYSSKEVPPLGKSTELTKHLARYGVRVNVRETERKRKKKERPTSVGPPYTTQKVSDRAFSEGSDDEDE